jgi:oligoendopeptidase F
MVTWNLSDLYNFEETDAKIDELKKLSKKFISKKHLLTNNISEKDFLFFIKLSEKMVEISSKIGGYSELWLSENTSD